MTNQHKPEDDFRSPHGRKYYLLGMQELEKGKWKAAEKAFRQAFSFEPGNKVIEKAIAEAISRAPKHSFAIHSS